MNIRRSALLLWIAAIVLPCHAWAQMDSREGIELQNQILELRQQVQQLQQSGMAPPTPAPGYQGGYTAPSGNSGDLTAQLLNRVQTLEDEVRTLRGQVDELQNQAQKQQQDFTKQLSDLSFQMQQGGGASAQSASAAPPSRTMSPPPGNLGASHDNAAPPPPPHRTPEMIMQEGNAALARRDYATAESAARELLANGRSPRAYDAQFLLAEAQAGARNYQQAAIAFDDAYNRNRAGSRAQDSLLGLAASLYNLGDKGAACGALNKLHAAFPAPRADIRQNETALRRRAGCAG